MYELGMSRRWLDIFNYTITWLLFAFSLVVDRDLLKDTHRWRQINVRSRQQTCFSFKMPPKSFNKLFEFLLYKTNRLHFSVCLDWNILQKTSQRVKNNSHATRPFCFLHAVTSYVIYYSTHTCTEKCNLFVKQKSTD